MKLVCRVIYSMNSNTLSATTKGHRHQIKSSAFNGPYTQWKWSLNGRYVQKTTFGFVKLKNERCTFPFLEDHR